MHSGLHTLTYVPRPLSQPRRRFALADDNSTSALASPIKPPTPFAERQPARELPEPYSQELGYKLQHDVQMLWHCTHYRVCWDPVEGCQYKVKRWSDGRTYTVGPLALVPPRAVLPPRHTWGADYEVKTSAADVPVTEDEPLLVLINCEHGMLYIQVSSRMPAISSHVT